MSSSQLLDILESVLSESIENAQNVLQYIEETAGIMHALASQLQ